MAHVSTMPDDGTNNRMVGNQKLKMDKRMVKQRRSKEQLLREIEMLKKEQLEEIEYNDGEQLINLRNSMLLVLNE